MKEVRPQEAYEILQHNKRAVLIDVRSSMEYEYVGHPLNALHVPIKEPPDWQITDNFTEKVHIVLKTKFPDERPEDLCLLMLCRSGKRSELGGDLLSKDGFKNVYNVLEGFEGDKDENGHRNTINGWRFHGLPWEQS